MTKEEIYEHLAKVYLGKKKEKKSGQSKLVKTLFVFNIVLVIAVISFFVGRYYYLSKFRDDPISEVNMLSLTMDNYPLRLSYNFQEHTPQIENFSMYLPKMDLREFDTLFFSIRGLDGKSPRLIKIALENQKKEHSEFYYSGVSDQWKKVSIAFKEFKGITDWSNMTRLAFIFEAWNLDEKEGKVLIDDVTFSNTSKSH